MRRTRRLAQCAGYDRHDARCAVSGHFIPKDFKECDTADNALWHVPEQEEEAIAIWLGFIPSPERYAAIYQAALRRRVRLVEAWT